MKKIKPEKLSLTHRCTVFNKDNLLFVNLLGAFSFDRPDEPLGEDVLWAALKEACGPHVFDEGYLKSRGEFIVHGSCHAPGGAPVRGCEVCVRVGGLSKRLTVFGDRYWVGEGAMTQATDPEPFTSMPLGWERAFGGKGYNRNRLGKGAVPMTLPTGETLRPLPNQEDPCALITNPGDRPEPAGLGLLGSLRFWRGRGLGAYGEKWFAEHWPYIAPDYDLDLINTACPDQWIEGYFKGGEDVEIHNMHPREPVLRTRLPRLRARAYMRRAIWDRIGYNELEPHWDTVWLLPERKLMLCVWRSMFLVSSQGARDVTHVCAELEHQDAPPKPRQHYLDVLGGAPLEPESQAPGAPPPPPSQAAPASAPTPAPVAAPASVSAPQAETPPPPPIPDPEMEAMLEKVRGILAKQGISIPTAPPPPPDPFGLGGPNPEEAMAKAGDLLKTTGEELQRTLAAQGIPVRPVDPAAPPDPRKLLAALDALDVRDARLAEGLKQLRAALAEDAASPPPPPTGAAPEPPAAATAPPPPPSSGLTRLEVLRRVGQGLSLARQDLTGLDLSAAPLAGADLREAILENVSLKGADLAGANLSGAILPGADLSGAAASRADFTGAFAHGAKAAGAALAGAVLARADFAGADFTGADLTGADLSRASLDKALLPGAVLAGCLAPGARFAGADATGAVFRKARMERAGFASARLDGADFEQAGVPGADFLNASGRKACFAGADLSGSQAPGGAAFQEADFTSASLAGATWTDCDLSHARLSGAVLDGASLRRTRLENADLTRSTARSAVLDEADLSGARLVAVNAFKASLREASLHKADMGDSNFFLADFFRARFHETNLAGSNLGRTILEKWRSIKL
ncbi:Secreted effector protein PipB2 [Fundidesulfovibrio magnetotacticus]|uniref:Secreted effector protein PipB2 n=1 Tax=Fundidesulfovibrio magnetotacticus TaxID=2730080 RepID=A0A6V8LP13_9BACT|nr:DUF2169 domain-containing protein [Fundidesulfovibrio magnetotacticus]GFK93454.1 Secreted effector protein PipB2 [Fundidesulfovibrio magnetotacticus]